MLSLGVINDKPEKDAGGPDKNRRILNPHCLVEEDF